MARTILVYSAPAILIAICWLRLETPSGGEAIPILLLALAPALLPSLRLRLAGSVVAGLVAARVALDVSPFDEGGLWHSLKDGTLEFYDVAVPFDPSQQPEMHGALLMGLFASALALALAIASRRPFLAVLAVVAGAGWPATLIADGRELLLGTAILAAALWILAGLRVRAPRAALPAAIVGAAVVAVAGAAATSESIAKGALFDWERWDPYDAPARPVGVDYVWDASYDGIDFPEKRTVVLRINAPRRSFYWRATTLDAFGGGRWFENLYPLTTRPVTGLTADRSAHPAATAGTLGAPGGRGRGAPRRPSRGRGAAGAAPRGVPRPAVHPERRRRASGRPLAAAGPDLRRVERSADADAAGARRPRAGLPGRGASGSRRRPPRPHAPVRRSGPGGAAPGRAHRRAHPEPLAPPAARPGGATGDAGGADAVRRPSSRWSRGSAAPAASGTRSSRRRRPGAAARRLRRPHEGRLLPALRRGDGAHAPLPRHPGACGGRLHERALRAERLDGDRPRRARLGRGLVPRAGLGVLRPDAGRGARSPGRTRSRPTRGPRRWSEIGEAISGVGGGLDPTVGRAAVRHG